MNSPTTPIPANIHSNVPRRLFSIDIWALGLLESVWELISTKLKLVLGVAFRPLAWISS